MSFPYFFFVQSQKNMQDSKLLERCVHRQSYTRFVSLFLLSSWQAVGKDLINGEAQLPQTFVAQMGSESQLVRG